MKNIQLKYDFVSPHGHTQYGVTGQGPAVVVCHGTPASSHIWDEVIEYLKDDFTFYYFDLPGYGVSDKFSGQDVRLRAFAQSMSAFIEELKLDTPHIVGHDFGAATVLGAHLVEAVPVKSITIADGVVLPPWGPAFSRHVKDNESVFAAVPEYVHEAVLRAHIHTAMTHQPPEHVLQAFVNPWLGGAGQAAYYRQVAQYDYDYTSQLEGLYPQITVPVTVLWGEKDAWVNISEGRRFSGMIPQAEFTVLHDAGHFSMIDAPSAFSHALKGALLSAE